MKIAIVTELFPPSVGGQEIRYAEAIPHFLRLGHEVSVACIDHHGDLPVAEKGDFSLFRLVGDPTYKRKGGRFGRNPRTVLRFAAKARKWVREGNFDAVIYNQWPVVPAFTGRKDARLSSVDLCEFRSGRMWNLLETRMAMGCHRATTVSQALADTFAQRFRQRPVRAIPSGIDRENYADTGRDHFLFFGRLDAHKNPGLAIEATLEFNKTADRPRVIELAGGGPLLEPLRRQYEGNAAVRLRGFVSDEERMDLLGRCEVLLLPSIREGFPRVIAEAMACGAPIVTTEAPDNGGKDVVRQFDVGAVVDLDPVSIAQGLNEALGDYDRLSRNGSERAAELDWRTLIANWASFLQEDLHG